MEELDRDDPGIPEPQVIIIRDANPLVETTKKISGSKVIMVYNQSCESASG